MENPYFNNNNEDNEIIKKRKVVSSTMIPIIIASMIVKQSLKDALYGGCYGGRPTIIIRDRSSIHRFKVLLGDHYFCRAY